MGSGLASAWQLIAVVVYVPGQELKRPRLILLVIRHQPRKDLHELRRRHHRRLQSPEWVICAQPRHPIRRLLTVHTRRSTGAETPGTAHASLANGSVILTYAPGPPSEPDEAEEPQAATRRRHGQSA